MTSRLAAFLSVLALAALGQSYVRTFDLVTDNAQFPANYDVSWMQGESLRFSITAKRGNFYVPLTSTSYPTFKAWSGTNTALLYANVTGLVTNATSGKVTIDVNTTQAAITPTGTYNYAVAVYDGTNFMGVVASGRATVRGYPFGEVAYVGTQPTWAGVTGATFFGLASGGITGRVITINASSPDLAALSNGVSAVGLTASNAAAGVVAVGLLATNNAAGLVAVGLVASNALPANGGDVVVGSLTIATNGLDLTAGQAITFNNGATLIEHPESGIDFGQPLYGDFIGNAAGLTNLPVYGGPGVTITQTSTGTVAANAFATFFVTNILAATNTIYIAIPSNSAASGLEITASIKTPSSDPYDLRALYFTVNGIEGGPVLYGHQWQYASYTSLAGSAITNSTLGALCAYVLAPHGITNTLSTMRLEMLDIYSSSQPKGYFSRWHVRADGNGNTAAYQYSGTADGCYTYGGAVTSVTLYLDNRTMDTGTVIRARLIP